MAYFNTLHEPDDQVWIIHDGGLFRAVVQKVMIEVLKPKTINTVFICDTGKEVVAVDADDIAQAHEDLPPHALLQRYWEITEPYTQVKGLLEEVA